MAFKLNNKILPVDVPFTSNGIRYPANWLRLSTADEKKGIGITEVSDTDTSYNARYYKSKGVPKSLEDETLKDKDDKEYTVDGLKTRFVAEQKHTANTLLTPYDWYVVRKAEKGTAIPSNITTYRDAVRSTCVTRENEIKAQTSVENLETLFNGTYDKDGKRTAGITLWPEEPS